MIIPEINLEIHVASRPAAESVLEYEPGRWCVISIRGPHETRANLSNASDAALVVFDDVASTNAMYCPRPVHAHAIIQATERFDGKPLLVHCAMGLSRSPAAALGILYHYAKKHALTDPVNFVLNKLDQLGDFKPNPLLARLMIEAVESPGVKAFHSFRKHPLWKTAEAEDLYSRLLPKPRRD